MTSVNRAALLTKTNRVLKKHFKPHLPDAKRPLLEQLLFACCLENAPPDLAEEAYRVLGQRFIDLNEIRVSSVRELSEVMHMLPDSVGAGSRVKGVLQTVFESIYDFDLEQLKKQNIGQAIKRLEKYEGVTPFVLAFATQVSLGGHSIPINQGALEALVIIGAITQTEADAHRVPGLERAIPKSKGIEFGSLLHQLGVMVFSSPYAPQTRALLLEIAPDCKDRLPKRRPKKVEPPEPPPAEEPRGKAAKKAATKEDAPPAAEAKPSAKRAVGQNKSSADKPAGDKKSEKKSAVKKSGEKESAEQKPPGKKSAEKKLAGKSGAESRKSAKKPAAASKAAGKKSAGRKPIKRKPR